MFHKQEVSTREDVGTLLLEAGTSDRLNLSSRNLKGIDLAGWDLTGADLHGVDFTEARLCGAILTGANLVGAKLAEQAPDQARYPPESSNMPTNCGSPAR
jgi:uncharacterized protein YjbI with pentapeptide repeats